MRTAVLLPLLLSATAVAAQTIEPEVHLASAERAPAPTPAAGTRRSAPLNLKFPDTSLMKVLDTLGEAAGVKVLYDADFRDKRVSISFQDETFDAALRQISLTNRLFYKALDGDTIAIVPDSPAKRRKYDGWVEPNPLPSVRNRAPIILAFTDASLRKVFDALGEAAGVKVLYDADFRDRRMSIRFNGETFEAALSQLTFLNSLFYKAVDTSAVVIAPDSPALRRRYETDLPASAGALGCGNEPSLGTQPEMGSIGFADGLWIGFVTRLGEHPVGAPAHKYIQAVSQPQGRRAVDRIVSDRERRHYVGYRLELQTSGGGRPFRVAIRPLPEASWGRLCLTCPSEAVKSRIARYPEPFELGTGGSFALELMENATTGEKVVDNVTIVQTARGRGKEPAARRFKVELTMAPEQGGLAAGVCVRDLESGEVLGGIPRFKVTPQSENLVLSLDGRTKDGRPLSISVRTALENDGRTALYTVEIWEAGEVVHSEEARFPLTMS